LGVPGPSPPSAVTACARARLYNRNVFVVGYSPTHRPTDAIVSIAARANGVGL
jgi:hypothetical protein